MLDTYFHFNCSHNNMNVFSYLDLFIYSLGNINIQIFYTIWYLIFCIIKREIFIWCFTFLKFLPKSRWFMLIMSSQQQKVQFLILISFNLLTLHLTYIYFSHFNQLFSSDIQLCLYLYPKTNSKKWKLFPTATSATTKKLLQLLQNS